jgi:hypothetical protein
MLEPNTSMLAPGLLSIANLAFIDCTMADGGTHQSWQRIERIADRTGQDGVGRLAGCQAWALPCRAAPATASAASDASAIRRLMFAPALFLGGAQRRPADAVQAGL